jgi:hypothetical protein
LLSSKMAHSSSSRVRQKGELASDLAGRIRARDQQAVKRRTLANVQAERQRWQGLPVRPQRFEPMPKMSLYKIAHRSVIVWTASFSAPSFNICRQADLICVKSPQRPPVLVAHKLGRGDRQQRCLSRTGGPHGLPSACAKIARRRSCGMDMDSMFDCPPGTRPQCTFSCIAASTWSLTQPFLIRHKGGRSRVVSNFAQTQLSRRG